jgi:hypothetical protein
LRTFGVVWKREKERAMRNFNLLVSLLVAGLLAGCASAGPPVAPEQRREAEVALRNAETAGAADYAPELLARSRQAMAAANRSEGETARQRLIEARDYAAAAEAKARAEDLRSQADRLRQEADDLESKADAIRDEIRPPS